MDGKNKQDADNSDKYNAYTKLIDQNFGIALIIPQKIMKGIGYYALNQLVEYVLSSLDLRFYLLINQVKNSNINQLPIQVEGPSNEPDMSYKQLTDQKNQIV